MKICDERIPETMQIFNGLKNMIRPPVGDYRNLVRDGVCKTRMRVLFPDAYLENRVPHHDNCIKFDDRPENLTSVTHLVHGRLHCGTWTWEKDIGWQKVCITCGRRLTLSKFHNKGKQHFGSTCRYCSLN